MEQHKHMLQAYPAPVEKDVLEADPRVAWMFPSCEGVLWLWHEPSASAETFREIPATKEFKNTNGSIQALSAA